MLQSPKLGVQLPKYFLTCRRLLFSPRRQSLSSSSTEAGSDGQERGGHPDRTRLKDDIYDDSPVLEAEQEYERSKEKAEQEEGVLKKRILSAALRFVPQHGWSKKAIMAGLEAENLPPMTHGLISDGPIELVHHFYGSANQEVCNKLAKEMEDVENGIAEKKKKTIFIKDALVYRLQMLIPYLDNWPHAMSLMALPPNIPQSLQHLSHLVDDIWYYAGDRSTDFNWYTKRATLAGVYKSTELCMLQDKSSDFAETWVFLDRRLKNLGTVGSVIRQVQGSTESIGQVIQGSVIVAKNLIGIPDYKR